MVTFSHLDEGTPEAVWQADDRIRTVPTLDDVDVDELIVVAAHPDDETLGAGGLIRRVHESGGRVTIIVATDGEASHPHSTSHAPSVLRPIRHREVLRAARTLAPRASVYFLGLSDGALRENIAALEEALTPIFEPISMATDRALVVAPWSGDGHRDHRVTAQAVARVAASNGMRHLGYPIWLWHWGLPDDVPWDKGIALRLTPSERSIKALAMGAHASQTRPLSTAPGDEAIVHDGMQAHFDRDTECFIVEMHDAPESIAEDLTADMSVSAEWFEDFYARHNDPWGFESRWYEERKRALLLACLPSRELGDVLEVGFATGLVTLELAARADHVFGLDASASAVSAARARIGQNRHVTLQEGTAPADWPAGEFDTVVFSEVGYYLSAADLQITVALIDSALSDDGCLVACHWRQSIDGCPLSGDEVHRVLSSVASWELLVHHEEEDFILDVFVRSPSVSVARREGLR